MVNGLTECSPLPQNCSFLRICPILAACVVQQHFVPMPWTLGVLDRPLGNTRLQTVRLIATLLNSHSSAVNDELLRLGTFNVLLVR